jgi:hypothetical protein
MKNQVDKSLDSLRQDVDRAFEPHSDRSTARQPDTTPNEHR